MNTKPALDKQRKAITRQLLASARLRRPACMFVQEIAWRVAIKLGHSDTLP
jgi:hypothetical protein